MSESNPSPLEREWRAARLRLFRGYAPMVVIVLAIVLTTLLVPSVAREQNVVTVREGLASTQTGATSGASSAGATGTAAGIPTAAGSPGASTKSAGSAAATTSPATRSGGGAAVTGTTTTCPGQALQVPGDPYSPPCIAFNGSNGGATSPGVTSSTITVDYRVTADYGSFNQSLGSLGGASFTASAADTERTIQGLVNYFNTKFQFYGRKLKVAFFNGQGSLTTEVQGGGQPQASADATTVAQQIHSFADIDAQDELYSQDLSQQHVVNIGDAFSSTNEMNSLAPYAWGPHTTCDTLVRAGMEVVTKELAGHPATAGGALNGQPRKFAIVAPANPDYQTCANEAVSLFKQAGVPVADNLQYTLNINTVAAQDDNIVAQLANDKITSVILLTDPVSPIFLTARAAQQSYTPEWLLFGDGANDTDAAGQLYSKAEWAHAFGVSFNGTTVPEQATLGYAAYKAVNSDEPATGIVDAAYANLDILALGLEMAGPNLTPTTFEQGMRAYPGSQAGSTNLQYGTWLFPANTFNTTQDSWLISWNPNKTSVNNNQPGVYEVDSPRYLPGHYPSGPAALPSGFPMTPSGS